MTLSFTRRVNRTLGVPDSGDVIMAEHVNELQAALEDVSAGTTPIPLAGIQTALGEWVPSTGAVASLPARPVSYSSLTSWAAFDATGVAADSWSATTYSNWITGLAAYFASEIASGDIVVADLGESSASGVHVYSYTAGEGPYKVLLVSGQHGAETLGIWSAMRWFEGFVRSTDRSYAAFRQLFTVTWIPGANPYNYNAGRKNGNAVDMNRNYDLLWSRYGDTSPSSSTYKGASAFSEPESVMIRDLLLANDYRIVLDLHNFNTGSDEGQLGLPGAWYLGARQFGLDVLRMWKATYGAGATTSLSNEQLTLPILADYANYICRHVNGKEDAATATVEMNSNFGSSTATLITASGMTGYCGLIHTYLGLWAARAGDALSVPWSYQFWANRSTQADSTSIASGGGLVDTGSGTYNTLAWEDMRPATSQIAASEVPIPVICAPAMVTIDLSAQMVTKSSGAGRFEFTVEIDGVSLGPTAAVTTSGTDGDRCATSVQCHKYYSSISNTSVPTLKVLVRKITGGACALRGVTAVVTVTPMASGISSPRVTGA